MAQNPLPVTETFDNALQEIKSNQVTLPKGTTERSIVSQMVQKFTISSGDNNSEIKMRLEPPSLGTVRMNVTTHGDTVKTTIVAENQAVKQIIENNLAQLKESFSGQGLKVESFQVMVGANQDSRINKTNSKSLEAVIVLDLL